MLTGALLACSSPAPPAPPPPQPTVPLLNTTQPASSPLTSPSPAATPTSRVGQPSPAPSAKPERVDIDLGDNFFSPNSVTVRAGTTVVWHNRGGGENQHNVEAEDSSFRSGDVSSGNTFAHTCSAPGRYAYVCSYHVPQGMTGEVIVE
jgi:plastocyanin